MLEAHNLYGWTLRASDVDETGKLVIARFFPASRDYFAFDTQIWTAFETNTFIKEDLLAYYKFLFDMIDWPSYLSTSTLLSPFDKARLFQLSHPEINLPVYSLPGWNKVVNGMQITMDEMIMMTLLPNMTIRCCIPTPQIPTFSIYEYMELFEQTDMTLFATWACQSNHLIHDLSISIMDLQTGKLVSFNSRLSSGYQNYSRIRSIFIAVHSLFRTGKRTQNLPDSTIYWKLSTFICFVP
ncbi:hypothetical protein C8J56DRAFT_81119 [Mycena floridula]|nr:hypothetical protein C8J56DRAFT_81119 [Mycena floridula]